MRQVRIPPDVGTYQERIFLNLTARQGVVLVLGGLTVWMVYSKLPLPRGAKDYLLLLLAPVFLGLGWVRIQGLSLERWIPILVAFLWWPQRRPWHPEEEVS